MKSKLIRILIVLCFVGMVVFGVVVFLSNHNVEAQVYSEITKIKNNTNFEALYKDANSVQPSADTTTVCGWVDYVNDSVKYLNEGIDYYLYYFQDMSGMNKKEKDKVVSGYKEYIKAINEAKNVLVIYESFESKGTKTENDKRAIAANSAYFAIEYLEAFAKGYDVFVELQNLVDDNVFGGKMFKNFTQVKYEMAMTFVKNSVSSVVGSLEAKKNYQTALPAATPFSNNDSAKNFNLLYNYGESKLTEGYEFREQNHANFLVNYNKIGNARAFLTDSSTYIANNSAESSSCAAAKTFLYSTYGIAV